MFFVGPAQATLLPASTLPPTWTSNPFPLSKIRSHSQSNRCTSLNPPSGTGIEPSRPSHADSAEVLEASISFDPHHCILQSQQHQLRCLRLYTNLEVCCGLSAHLQPCSNLVCFQVAIAHHLWSAGRELQPSLALRSRPRMPRPLSKRLATPAR